MHRFFLENATILDSDGENRIYEIIVDTNSTVRVETPFGEVKERWGFIRCRGKQYLGTFGRETPVLVGESDEIYYAPMHEFDGEWYHAGADSRGLYQHVTARSGRGLLFAALENFCAANNVAAQY